MHHNLVIKGPLAILVQDDVVRGEVFRYRERLIYTFVQSVYFFIILDNDRAPIVAVFEGLRHWAISCPAEIIYVRGEALANIAEKGPEEVTFILVLCTHYLM